MAVASGSDGNKTRQHIHVHYSFGHSRDNYPRAVARLFKIFVHLRQHLSAQAVNGDGIRRFFQTFYRVTHDITAKRHKSAVGKRVVMAVKARRPNDIGKMRTALKNLVNRQDGQRNVLSAQVLNQPGFSGTRHAIGKNRPTFCRRHFSGRFSATISAARRSASSGPQSSQ